MIKGIFKFINVVSVGLIFVDGAAVTKPTKTPPVQPIESYVPYRIPDDIYFFYDTHYMTIPEGTEDIVIDCFNEIPSSNIICDLDKKCYNYDHSFEYYNGFGYFQCNVYNGIANDTTPTTTDKLYPICKPTYSSSIEYKDSFATHIPCTTNVGEDEFKTITCAKLYKKEPYYTTGTVCQTYTSDPEYFNKHKLTPTPISVITSTSPPPTPTLPPLPTDKKYTTLEVNYKNIPPFTAVVSVPTDVIDVYYYGCNDNMSHLTFLEDQWSFFDRPEYINSSNKYICDFEDCISFYEYIGNYCRLYTYGPNEPKPTSTGSRHYSEETTYVNVLCHTTTKTETVTTTIEKANYSVTTIDGNTYNTYVTQYTSLVTVMPITNYYCAPKPTYSSSTPIPTPTSTVETTKSTCPKAEKLGYKCCTDCNSIYEDDDGQWGVEDGEWCGIPEQCSEDNNESETCWSEKEGYSCCDHCNSIYEDESGLWGVMNNEWCSIPSS
eukprot:jgi/Orpsp1_1/1190051/evm.model.d7180000076333.1